MELAWNQQKTQQPLRPDNGVNFVFFVFLLQLIWSNTFRPSTDFKA
jgi:hypothetical protein